MDAPLDSPRRRWFRIFAYPLAALAVVLSGLALAGAAVMHALDESVELSDYGTGLVEHLPLEDQVRAPGALVPSEVLHVAAPEAATVSTVLVEPGQLVEVGDVLAELRNPAVNERLSSARAELALAESSLAAGKLARTGQLLDLQSLLAATEAEVASAELQVAAELELANAQIISRLQYERTRLDLDYRRKKRDFESRRLAAARVAAEAHEDLEQERIRALRELVQLGESDLASLRVRAGMAGVVQDVKVLPGQHVAPGAALATIAKPDVLHAEVKVPEEQARGLAAGQPARVRIRDIEVAGRVSRVDPAVRLGTVLTVIAIEGPLPATARPDLRIEASIALEGGEPVLSVPRPPAAVPGELGVAYRIDPRAGHVTRTKVRWGRASATRIEVVEGLAPGDRIVLLDPAHFGSRTEIATR